MSSNQNCKVSLSEEDLLEIYNNAPKALSKNVAKVSIKEESLRNLHQEPIYLIESRNGNYWLISTEDGNYLLLPKNNLKINSFEYQTVKSLFECQGYQAEDAREFTLTKAARVLLTSKGEWMLEDKGILEFCVASPLSQLQLQLEQAQDEYIQLQFQLEQLRSQLNQSEYERVQLLSRLSQVEQERQHILASLEQLAKSPQGEQLFNHMEQATQDHKLFFSEMQKFYTSLNSLTYKVFTLEEHLETLSKQINISNRNVSKQSHLSEVIPIQTSSRVESKSSKTMYSANSTTEEKDLDKFYNEPNKKNLRHLVKVLPIQELIEKDSFGKPTKLFFQENVRGTYWIVTSEQKKYLLFPEHNFKVNEFNYKGLETAFTCHGNWQDEGAELRIFKPAIVKPLEEGKEKWELVDQGVIEFTPKK